MVWLSPPKKLAGRKNHMFQARNCFARFDRCDGANQSTSGRQTVAAWLRPLSDTMATALAHTATTLRRIRNTADSKQAHENVGLLEKHFIHDGDNTITLSVDGELYRPGMEPNNTLVDRVPENNRKRMTLANPAEET